MFSCSRGERNIQGMDTNILLLHNWFSGFTSSFRQSSQTDQSSIDLKIVHTAHVVSNAAEIAAAEGLDRGQVRIARAVALLHDVGRFPQYHHYRTFRDRDSVDHGALSAEIAARGVLDGFPTGDRQIILQAVRFHNSFRLPSDLEGEALLQLRLIRDADKLDIWRVFLEYYGLPSQERSPTVGLGFPDLPGVSSSVLQTVRRGEMVDLSTVRTLNDFKLLQLSWVYDLNFPASFRMLKRRNRIRDLADTITGGGEIAEAVATVEEYMTAKIGAEKEST
jgi:hypothetical protein